MMQRVFPLRTKTQQYQWGKVGADSMVAQLAVDDIQDDQPYAGKSDI